MTFEIVTLFPDYFTVALRQSLLGKAQENGLFEIRIVNLRDFATDTHRTVDDAPYGGGGGMVMMVEPLDRCLKALGYSHRDQTKDRSDNEVLLLTTAAGNQFDQTTAIRYSLCERLTIVCGHYMGIDERISELYDFEQVSIGDYILTGGEPAASVIVDAVARLIPKVLGNFESALGDSYMNQLLGCPSYTRPAEYMGLKVPEVLLSGNHIEIARYRRMEAIRRCLANRPDLIRKADLGEDEIKSIRQLDENIDID